MRTRTIAGVALLSLAGISLTGSARADGLLLVPTGTQANVSHEEVATTFGASTHALWSRLALTVNAPTFTWLLPMPAGSRADFANDAWFPALEGASAPRVIPPVAPSPCESPATPEIATWGVDGTEVSPTNATVIASSDALTAYAMQWNVDPTNATDLTNAAFAQGGAFLALTFTTDTNSFAGIRTPTIRITGPAEFPLGMSVGASFSTVVAIGPGTAQFHAAPPSFDATSLTWGATGSNYAYLRSIALLTAGESHFLIESANQEALFTTRIDTGVAIPSVASSYFSPTDGACEGTAAAIVSSPETVSTTCTPGALGVFGSSPCDSTVGADQIDALTLRCGGDDFAIALAGATPSATVVTRAVVAGDAPSTVDAFVIDPTPTVLQADIYDSACLAEGNANSNATAKSAAAPSASPPSSNGAVVSGGSDDGPSAALEAASDASDSGDGCSCDSDSPASDDAASSSDSCSGADSGGGDAGGCSGGGGGAPDDCSLATTHTRKHGKSPMSRIAMVAACSILFLRRRSRRVEA